MDNLWMFEMIGHLGSVLVIISMMMTSMIKLRFFNASGCVLSVIYASIIQSYPVLILNSVLFIINVVQIWRHYKSKRSYDIVNSSLSSDTLKHFINKYQSRIKLQNPIYGHYLPYANYAKVIFCDDTVVGMFVGKKSNDALDLCMDYIDKNYWRNDLYIALFKNIYKDGVRKIVFKDVPEKIIDKYVKDGCVQDGNDCVLDLTWEKIQKL